MKTCNNCNTQNADDSQFCVGCGMRFEAVNTVADETSYNDANNVPPQSTESWNLFNENTDVIRPTGTDRFVSADEYVIATLENGYAMNMISGEGLKKEDAILTNRRLYYNHTEGILNVRTQEEKVNVKDITGTKIADYNPIYLLILSIIMFAIILFGLAVGSSSRGGFPMVLPTLFSPALIFLVLYFVLKKKYLKIEYAGGAIHFSVKKYGMQNIQMFQKSIHAVKDYIEDHK